MALRFTVEMLIEVEEDAPFLEFDKDEQIVLELFKDMVYDFDDVRLKEIQVENIS